MNQSRYGYHPCDYQTLLKLKQYTWCLYRAYCRHKRAVAWQNKTVYRSGPQPIVHPLLSSVGPNGKLEFACLRIGHEDVNLYFYVLNQYREARRPVATAEEVAPLNLSPDWLEKLRVLTEFHGALTHVT